MFSWATSNFDLISSSEPAAASPPAAVDEVLQQNPRYAPKRRLAQRMALNANRTPYIRQQSGTQYSAAAEEAGLLSSIASTLVVPVSYLNPWYSSPAELEPTSLDELSPPTQRPAVRPVKPGALCGDVSWLGRREGEIRQAVTVGRHLNMRREVISDFWMRTKRGNLTQGFSPRWLAFCSPPACCPRHDACLLCSCRVG